MNQPEDMRGGGEEAVAEAFSRQSSVFDDLYGANTIVSYKRSRVRAHFLRHLAPGSSILELNCGTGEDALYFAGQGHRVHATDISTGMLEVLAGKVAAQNVTWERRSFTALEDLKERGPYDAVFSNFGGLNCTDRLDTVLASLPSLVKPGGTVCLVILPEFCLWEALLVLRGKWKTAFRRFFSRGGRSAHIEGKQFLCWYYNPGYVIRRMSKEFRVLELEGLCSIVPPSYIEHFAERHPRAYRFLRNCEERWKGRRPWRSIGDYYILSLERAPGADGF